MGLICPHELKGSKESLKLYNRMLKHCIYEGQSKITEPYLITF